MELFNLVRIRNMSIALSVPFLDLFVGADSVINLAAVNRNLYQRLLSQIFVIVFVVFFCVLFFFVVKFNLFESVGLV